jgi:putative endonuclease
MTNSIIYIGVTGRPLGQRVWEHKNKVVKGFTHKYNVNKLVYYEIYGDANSAISREKQLKAGSRYRKMLLIGASNPEWRDLFDDLY